MSCCNTCSSRLPDSGLAFYMAVCENHVSCADFLFNNHDITVDPVHLEVAVNSSKNNFAMIDFLLDEKVEVSIEALKRSIKTHSTYGPVDLSLFFKLLGSKPLPQSCVGLLRNSVSIDLDSTLWRDMLFPIADKIQSDFGQQIRNKIKEIHTMTQASQFLPLPGDVLKWVLCPYF